MVAHDWRKCATSIGVDSSPTSIPERHCPSPARPARQSVPNRRKRSTTSLYLDLLSLSNFAPNVLYKVRIRVAWRRRVVRQTQCDLAGRATRIAGGTVPCATRLSHLMPGANTMPAANGKEAVQHKP